MERIANTSWFVDGNNKVIKLCDKTVLRESNTILPMNRIKDFFYNIDLEVGESVTQKVNFMGEECKVLIKKYNNKSQGNPSRHTYLGRGIKLINI